MPQGPNMNQLLKQAQQMQAEMAKAQEQLKSEIVEASAGGGMVKVTMTGDMQLREITISPEAVDPEDVDMLQDMVAAAVNEALRSAQELAANRMGGIAGLGGGGMPGPARYVMRGSKGGLGLAIAAALLGMVTGVVAIADASSRVAVKAKICRVHGVPVHKKSCKKPVSLVRATLTWSGGDFDTDYDLYVFGSHGTSTTSTPNGNGITKSKISRSDLESLRDRDVHRPALEEAGGAQLQVRCLPPERNAPGDLHDQLRHHGRTASHRLADWRRGVQRRVRERWRRARAGDDGVPGALASSPDPPYATARLTSCTRDRSAS